MNIDTIASITNAPDAVQSVPPDLRTACAEFEGIFLAILLKDGMKPSDDSDSESSSGSALQEFAMEQVARNLGESGSLGIARMMLQQLGVPETSHDKR